MLYHDICLVLLYCPALVSNWFKGSAHNDTKPSVMSMRCIVNKICFHKRRQMLHNDLSLRQQRYVSPISFQNFITTQWTQHKALCHYVNPALFKLHVL